MQPAPHSNSHRQPVAPSYAHRLIGVGLGVLLLGCAPSPDLSSAPATPAAPPQPAIETTQELGLGQVLPISAQAIIGEYVLQLEVARTPTQQAMGLMHRPALPDDRGMLFPFEVARPVSFWMRNVPVPLDMVFMRDGEVKAIAANAPPCTTPSCPTYGPDEAVNQVIELRGGRAAELGLAVGDRILIEYLPPEIDVP